MFKDDLNIDFIILCPDVNIGQLKLTSKSIKNTHKNSSFVAIVPKGTNAEDIKEYKEICPVFKGKDTVASMMNTGLKNGGKEWNAFLMEGSFLDFDLSKKYASFCKCIKDILMPIDWDCDIQGKPTKIYSNFYDCSLNGLTIHQKTFKEVGDFSDNPLEISRLMWSLAAVEVGCKFKSILGTKIC